MDAYPTSPEEEPAGREGRGSSTTPVCPAHPEGAGQRERLRPELQDAVLGDSQEMPNLLEPLD